MKRLLNLKRNEVQIKDKEISLNNNKLKNLKNIN